MSDYRHAAVMRLIKQNAPIGMGDFAVRQLADAMVEMIEQEVATARKPLLIDLDHWKQVAAKAKQQLSDTHRPETRD